MKKLDIYKIANVVSLFVVFALVLTPMLAAAQFEIPDPNVGGTGLPGDSNVTTIIIRIINILLAVAGLIAVIFLIIGGFRYITAGGNEELSESGKKTIQNAIIGVVVIILSFVIVRIISNALISNAV